MIFISYSSKEYAVAKQVCDLMSTNGFHCWMAPHSIPVGSNYALEIPHAIRSCDGFLLLLSQASQDSTWVSKELDLALSACKPIFPLRIDNSPLKDSFLLYLSNIQQINAIDDLPRALRQICTQLDTARSEPTAAPSLRPIEQFDFFGELRARLDHHRKKRSEPEDDWLQHIGPPPAKAESWSRSIVNGTLRMPSCRKVCLNTAEGTGFTICEQPNQTSSCFIMNTVLNPAKGNACIVPSPLIAKSLPEEDGLKRTFFTLPPLRRFDYDHSNEWGDDLDVIILTVNHDTHSAFLNTAIICNNELYISEHSTQVTAAYLPSRNPKYMLRWMEGANEELSALAALGLTKDFTQCQPETEHVESPFRQDCFTYLIIDPDTCRPILPELFVHTNNELCVRLDFDPAKKYICLQCSHETANDYHLLGIGYLHGAGGVCKDNHQAARWFLKGASATPPDLDCAYELGCMLRYVPEFQNCKEALHYLSIAALEGHEQAMFEVAKLLLEQSSDPAGLQQAAAYLHTLLTKGYERCGEDSISELLHRVNDLLR